MRSLSILSFTGAAYAAALARRDITYSQSTQDSTFARSFGLSSQNSTVNAGVTVWLSGGGTHNFYGNLNNNGNIIVSQTDYLKQNPYAIGQTADFVGSTPQNGNLVNNGFISLNDYGSTSAPIYDWYLHTMQNSGGLQFCGRGDTGGSSYQLYCDLDCYNYGVIDYEQYYSNLGASFVWRNTIIGLNAPNNIHNEGAFRLVNTVYHNVQNVQGSGCWVIDQGSVLYLEDGTGAFQNPGYGPSFPNQKIYFVSGTMQPAGQLQTLHMDTQVYSHNSNFGPQVYGFGTGNAIEFYEIIRTFSYSNSILNVVFVSGNQVNIKLGAGYDASQFYKAQNPQQYNILGYNAIFYRGSAPAQQLPGVCQVSLAKCADPAFTVTLSSTSSTTTATSKSSTSAVVTTTVATASATTPATTTPSTTTVGPTSSTTTKASTTTVTSSATTTAAMTPSSSASISSTTTTSLSPTTASSASVSTSTSVSSASSSSASVSPLSTTTSKVVLTSASTSQYTTSAASTTVPSTTSTTVTSTSVATSTTSVTTTSSPTVVITSIATTTTTPVISQSTTTSAATSAPVTTQITTTTPVTSAPATSSTTSTSSILIGNGPCAYGAQPSRVYTTSNGDVFGVCLNTDFPGGDSTNVGNIPDANSCADVCSKTPGCVAGAFSKAANVCYLKSTLNVASSNNNVDSVYLISGPSSSATVSATTTSAAQSTSAFQSTSAATSSTVVSTSVTSASSTVITTAVTSASTQSSSITTSSAAQTSASSGPCANGAGPDRIYTAANGDIYGVCLNTDFPGGNLNGPAVSASSPEQCADICSQTAGCVAGNIVHGGPCYLKSKLMPATSNSNVDGVYKISSGTTVSTPVGSTSAASTSAVATTSAGTSSPVSTSSSITLVSTTSSAPATTTSASTGPCANGAGPDSTLTLSNGDVYGVCLNTDFNGGDLSNTNGINSPRDLAQACSNTPGCVAGSVIRSAGVGYLKNVLNPGTPNNNVDSVYKISSGNGSSVSSGLNTSATPTATTQNGTCPTQATVTVTVTATPTN